MSEALRAGTPWGDEREAWQSPMELQGLMGAVTMGAVYDALHRLTVHGVLERRDTTREEAHAERWNRVTMVYRPARG